MHPWTIRCFCNVRGDANFDEDYREQSADARARFRATLSGLKAQPTIDGWSLPNGFERLSGKYGKLGKIKFKTLNVHHCPLGFFGPGARSFTLLIWATERDAAFSPPDVRDIALERIKIVTANPERAHELDF